MRMLGCFAMLATCVACQPSMPAPIPTKKPLPTKISISTSTLIPNDTPFIPTATILITPIITATPINAIINTGDDVKRLVKQFYTWWSPCIGYNFATSSSEMSPPRNIEFIEVNIQSDPYMQFILEIADNHDKSYQAFTACENMENCHPKIFVKDIAREKIYEVNWEARIPWRPIDSVIWFSDDVFGFYQSVNPERAQVIVIDFEKRSYVFDALIFPDYFCSTSTPTP